MYGFSRGNCLGHLKRKTKDVVLDRIEHEYLFNCSDLVVNGCFFISNPH